MRWQLKMMTVLLAAFIGLALATSQAQFQIGGGGMGGIGALFGKDARPNPLVLMRNKGVKKELRLTDEQLDKADAAVWEALAKVLTPDQFKRLMEIDLQQRDYDAFGDTSVQGRLKLNKDQKDSIKTILHDTEKELQGIMKELKEGNFQAATKVTSIRKETKDRCTEVLTAEQRRTWQDMLGEDFKFETPGDFKMPDLNKLKGTKKAAAKGGVD